MRKFKRRDLCVYTGPDFFGLDNGTLVEVLGMDDNARNMIVFYGEDYPNRDVARFISSMGVLHSHLKYIDHISQLLNLNKEDNFQKGFA